MGLSEEAKKRRNAAILENTKRSLAEGKTRQILMRLDADLADEFDRIVAAIGGSRPQAIRKLCEMYNNQNQS